jgi:hypothetical protein
LFEGSFRISNSSKGYGCHAVLPEVLIEMKHPKSFNKMMAIAFSGCFFFYIAWGSIAYLMFGESTLENVLNRCYSNKIDIKELGHESNIQRDCDKSYSMVNRRFVSHKVPCCHEPNESRH